MDEPRPVLVTGASGCIGAWTVRRLLDDGVPVVAFDLREDTRRLRLLLAESELESLTWVCGDIADRTAIEHALDRHRVGSVIHLAALQAPFCRADPPLGARVNVVGTVNLLDAIAARSDRGFGPFVYASSIAAAGWEGSAHPSTVYGVYKRACEGTAEIYWRERRIAGIGLRPHTVYGPGRDQGLTSAPSLAMAAAAAGVAYEIPFSGRLTMQYAPEVAGAFVAASRCSGYAGAGVFELPGATVDVVDIIDAIAAVSADASITCSGPPLPFAANVAADPEAPFASAVDATPLNVGVADAIRRFRDLHARDLLSVTAS